MCCCPLCLLVAFSLSSRLQRCELCAVPLPPLPRPHARGTTGVSRAALRPTANGGHLDPPLAGGLLDLRRVPRLRARVRGGPQDPVRHLLLPLRRPHGEPLTLATATWARGHEWCRPSPPLMFHRSLMITTTGTHSADHRQGVHGRPPVLNAPRTNGDARARLRLLRRWCSSVSVARGFPPLFFATSSTHRFLARCPRVPPHR